MRFIIPILFCALLSLHAEDTTPIEISKPLEAPGGGLGTKGYEPTKKEAELQPKVNGKTADDKMSDVLPGNEGNYVGWFGIVRDIKEDKDKKETTLLVEHKHFDGLTDLHIHIVSIYGGGDFNVVLKGTGLELKNLSLVRVLGSVDKAKAGILLVHADYVRTWDWGLFTFMDYGEEKGNKKWIDLRKINGNDVYTPRPSKKFYEAVLGPR